MEGMAMPMGNSATSAFEDCVGIDSSRPIGGSMTGGKKASHGEKVVYTCPMHPAVISNRPGTCPKCGMTLTKKNRASSSPENR
jgi:hypothetical protein